MGSAADGRTETDDVVALGRLQSRYADVVTRRAWGELAELFLPDATVELDLVTSPVRVLHGPGELGAFVGAAVERFDHFAVVILNAVVEVDPPAGGGSAVEATGRMFMQEQRHEPEGDVWSVAHGLYRDRYRFDGGRWRFAARRYRSLARQGPATTILGLPDDLR